jgi:Predicted metal-dependent hydrolase
VAPCCSAPVTTNARSRARNIDRQFRRQCRATEWLARQGVVHFGIDSMRPGPEGKVNALVHKACLDLDITHIESLCNLEALLGKGQFTFIGLPMKWRGGTASPIRAVAVFDI